MTYTGNAQFAGSGTVSGANLSATASSLTYSANANGTGLADEADAGTYYVTAHYAGDANHNASDGQAVAIVINKAVSTTTTVGAGPFTYTGNAQLAGSGMVSGVNLSTTASSLTYSANADGSGLADLADAGTYYVTAHYAGDANHIASDGQAVAIVMNKASSTTTTVGVGSLTYTGNAQLAGSGTVSGINLSTTASSLTYSASSDGTGVADVTDAGTYYVTAHYAGDANHTASNGQAVAIMINPALMVTTQPSNTTVSASTTASFSAAASGSPVPTVQWQVSLDNGASWNNVAGATTATYSFTTTASKNGWKFRAVFTNAAGSATTSAATLTVATPPVVISASSNVSVNAGAVANFTAQASGTPTPSVQWQVSLDTASTWNNIAGATSSTYSFTTAATDNGKQFRAVFTNSVGSATTIPAVLSVAQSNLLASVIGVGIKWGTNGSAALFDASGGTLLPSGRTVDIPWANINQISITLNQSVSSLNPTDVSVTGSVAGNYGPVTVTGSGTSWTITLAKAIASADKVTVVIGNSQLTSYQRILNVLPGDVNDDSVVSSTDVTLENSAINGPYNVFADYYGLGVVDANDLKGVRGKVGTKKII